MSINFSEIIYNYKFSIKLNLTGCKLGEIFDENLVQCVICGEGTYSIDLNQKSCILCPKEATECYANVVSLKLGYWRSSHKSSIYSCSPNHLSCL